jgi:hypothetical protein
MRATRNTDAVRGYSRSLRPSVACGFQIPGACSRTTVPAFQCRQVSAGRLEHLSWSTQLPWHMFLEHPLCV